MTETHRHELQRVRRAFDRAAKHYDAAAEVQRQVAAALRTLLPDTAPGPRLDAGCGTGQALPWLRALPPDAPVLALDFAPLMLARARQRLPDSIPLCADMEALPLSDASIALAWSSLAVQWCEPGPASVELARVLAPGGTLVLSSLGPATLIELRHAFAGIDAHQHVRPLPPVEALREALLAAGLVPEHFSVATHTLHRPHLRAVLNDLKGIGANVSGSEQRRAPLGRAAWRTVEARYEALRTEAGLPVSYEVVLVRARKLKP